MVVASLKTKRGATVLIADDYMAPGGSALECKVIEEQRQAAHDILVALTGRKGKQHEDDKSA